MEIDIDDVPWKDDLVTEPPRIENGHLIMPTKPGWGADINEDVVKRHPPKWYPSVTTVARGGTEYEQTHQRCWTHGLKAVAPAGSKALPFLDVAAAGGYDLSFKLSVLAAAPGLLVAYDHAHARDLSVMPSHRGNRQRSSASHPDVRVLRS
jgi:hypothetical protein